MERIATAFRACGPNSVTGADARAFGGTLWRDIFFSVSMVAPYRGGRGRMFRVVNRRRNQLFDVRARVHCRWIDRSSGSPVRRYHVLALERTEVVFFAPAWTIVQPLTDESPIGGRSDADLRSGDDEFPVVVSGADNPFSQQLHTRTSYKADEIVWGAKAGTSATRRMKTG